MNKFKLGFAFGLLSWGLLAGPVQAQSTQCVSNALAGGTADAMTIPLLPCGLSTNILILTLNGTNTTATPTLQMAGFPAMRIYTNTLANPGIGDLGGAGSVVMLTGTGTSWLVINGNVGGYLPLPLSVANGGTGAATLTGVLQGNGASPITAGTITVANGGTGKTSVTANGVLYGNGTSAFGVVAPGTTGEVLAANTGSAPTWSGLSNFGVSSVNFDTTGLTPATATAGVITVGGVLVPANGGTGLSSYAIGDLLYANGAASFAKLAGVATGNALISGGVATAPSWGKISLTGAVSGVLPVASGGTNIASYTIGDLIYASGATALSKLAGVATGQVLVSGGVGVAPAWAALSSTAVSSISFGTTGLTPNSATQGAVTVAGTLAVANGGTNITSYTTGDILYASAAGVVNKLADVAVGQYLASGGTGTAPAYASALSLTGTSAILTGTAIPAGGTAGSGYKFSSTANFGTFFGSGAPSASVAQGSLYLRSDGLPYYNTTGSTVWDQLDGLANNATITGTKTFNGTSGTLALKLVNGAEPATISATAATGTITYDVCTQSIVYYTSSAAANWTVNFRCSSGTSLNTAMATGDVVTVTFLVTQGATAYYNSAVQVDAGAVTPKYQGGTAWSAGNVSSIDGYTYAITKTGNAAFTIFASQTQFK